MGIQRISANELIDGIVNFASDCLNNKLGPSQQLDFSNGETAAGFHYILFEKPDDLYWSVAIQVMQNEVTNPASKSYIAGYNKKAVELGMPLYNSDGNMIKLIIILAILYKMCQLPIPS
jgi:hypothetical protein